MPRLPTLLAFAVACSSSRLAFGAEPSRPSSSDEPPFVPRVTTETTWYGWQTLTADALSIGTVFATQGDAATVGFVGYLAGAPIIHAVHGNVAKGGGSVGLRIGLPVVGGGIGLAFASCNGPYYCRFEAFGLGFLGGMVAAVAIDSAALAYERQPPKPLPRVFPNVALSRGGAVVTASGSF
jgi:hypothetical protein